MHAFNLKVILFVCFHIQNGYIIGLSRTQCALIMMLKAQTLSDIAYPISQMRSQAI